MCCDYINITSFLHGWDNLALAEIATYCVWTCEGLCYRLVKHEVKCWQLKLWFKVELSYAFPQKTKDKDQTVICGREPFRSTHVRNLTIKSLFVDRITELFFSFHDGNNTCKLRVTHWIHQFLKTENICHQNNFNIWHKMAWKEQWLGATYHQIHC